MESARSSAAVATSRRARRLEGDIEGDIDAADVIGPGGQGIAAGEMDELIRAMRKGYAYANVHTTLNQPGLIRGQIQRGHGHDRGRGGGSALGRRPFVIGEPGRKAGLFSFRRPSSRRMTARPNSAARAPSTTRWSNVSET